MKNSEWIDVSVPLRSGMVHWPGDQDVEIEQVMDTKKGDKINLKKIDMSVHTGTHMDSPNHFIDSGIGIDKMPPTATIGRTRVLQINDPESIKPDELEKHNIRAGERILFKTKNSENKWYNEPFKTKFVYISHEAAEYLAELGVQTVGVDYLSVSGYKIDEVQIHTALLGAGIWIIEGIHLAGVEPGEYEMVCLPLKIENGDGAPARAVLRRIE